MSCSNAEANIAWRQEFAGEISYGGYVHGASRAANYSRRGRLILKEAPTIKSLLTAGYLKKAI